MEAPELNDEAEVLEVLRALVEQLRGSGFPDKHGHPIEMNVAFQDAEAALALRGLA